MAYGLYLTTEKSNQANNPPLNQPYAPPPSVHQMVALQPLALQ